MGKDNTTLFDLTGELLQLYDAMSDPDYDIEALMDSYEAAEGAWEDKMDGYAAVMKKQAATIDALSDMEKRLQSKRKTIENNIEKLKRHMKESMEVLGKRKVETTFWKYIIKKNNPSVVIDNQAAVPKEFLRFAEPTVDKKALGNALKDGMNLDGIAHLAQTERIEIS